LRDFFRAGKDESVFKENLALAKAQGRKEKNLSTFSSLRDFFWAGKDESVFKENLALAKAQGRKEKKS
jgi:hypothetical protein